MAKPKLKIYLDTSVLSAYFDQRDLRIHQVTKDFWQIISQYEIYISQTVLEEIANTPELDLRGQLDLLAKQFNILSLNDEVNRLAKIYIKAELIPEKYPADALHLAYPTFYQLDLLISWNLAHIVKYKTQTRVIGINKLEGYPKEFSIITPEQLL